MFCFSKKTVPIRGYFVIKITGGNGCNNFRNNFIIFLSSMFNGTKIENLFKKSKICSKIENLFKNKKFVQKSKICSKIENLFKNRKFVQKSKICRKIENLLKKDKILTTNSQNLVCQSATRVYKWRSENRSNKIADSNRNDSVISEEEKKDLMGYDIRDTYKIAYSYEDIASILFGKPAMIANNLCILFYLFSCQMSYMTLIQVCYENFIV